ASARTWAAALSALSFFAASSGFGVAEGFESVLVSVLILVARFAAEVFAVMVSSSNTGNCPGGDHRSRGAEHTYLGCSKTSRLNRARSWLKSSAANLRSPNAANG